MEKNYVSGILIKETGQFGQLNVSIKVEDFIEQLQGLNNNGWVNLVIAKNRNPTDKGYTHHCYENTWRPESSQSSEKKPKQEEINTEFDNSTQSDLPF